MRDIFMNAMCVHDCDVLERTAAVFLYNLDPCSTVDPRTIAVV